MSKRKFTLYIIGLLLATFSVNELSAQEKQKSTKKQYKEFMKLQDDRDAELGDKMDEKRKQHLKIQTKETQKRMKKNKKKADRMKKDKHQSTFLQRLFTKKPKGR